MISWSAKHIALIAIFFFTAFAGVFTTNALCDLEIIEYAPNLQRGHADASNEPHHDDEHDHKSDKNNPTSDAEDPCCDDVTSRLEASLFSKILKNQTVEAKYFLMGGIVLSHKLITFYRPIHNIYHEYDNPPPLDGFSIRVLIQSFLN